MKRLSSLCLALLALLLFALPNQAQDAEPPAKPKVWPKCLKCKTTGKSECPDKRHKKLDLALDVDALYCSEINGCETCQGVGWIGCKKCERPDVDAVLEKRLEGMAEHRDLAASYDKEMGFKLHTVMTENFSLVFEIESMKVGKKRLKQHALMHLYANRLEDLMTDYLTSLKIEGDPFARRIKVFVWWSERDQRAGSLRFAQMAGGQGVRLLGDRPVYSVCGGKQFHKNDESVHRNLVHNVTHLMMSHQPPIGWIGNKKGGWVEAGLAHWFEDRYFNVCDNYCFQEQDSNVDFKGGKWKPAVRKMVQTDSAPGVGSVMSRNTDQLLLPEHAVAFSYVDYLMQLDPKKFDTLVVKLHGGMSSRDALSEVFGMTPIGMETKWKVWVKETYPLR